MKLSSILIRIFSTSVLRAVVALSIGFLLVLYLGTKEFGVYSYLFAIFGLPEAFYGSLDSIVRRFAPNLNSINCFAMTLIMAVSKLLILIIVGAIGLALHFQWDVFQLQTLLEKGMNYQLLALSFGIMLPIQLLATSLMSLAQTHQHIPRVQYIILFLEFLKLLLISSLILMGISVNTGLWVLGLQHVIFHGLLAIIWFIFLYRMNYLFSITDPDLNTALSETWRLSYKYYKSYGLPLVLLVLSASIKNRILALLLGNYGKYEELGLLEAVLRIYKFFNKMLPALFKMLVPKLSQLKEELGSQFDENLKMATRYNLLLVIMLSIFLLFSHPIWLKLMGLTVDKAAYSLVILSSSAFIVWGGMQTMAMVSFMSDSTWEFLVSTLIDTVCLLVTLFYLVKYGAWGGAVSNLISSYVSYLSTIFLMRRVEGFRAKEVLWQFLCANLMLITFYLTNKQLAHFFGY